MGLNETSITDNSVEFTLTMNGQPIPGLTVNGKPVAVTGGMPNTYRYSVTGTFPNVGEVEVNFQANSWYDKNGTVNAAETEHFSLVMRKPDGTLPPPAPSARDHQ